MHPSFAATSMRRFAPSKASPARCKPEGAACDVRPAPENHASLGRMAPENHASTRVAHGLREVVTGEGQACAHQAPLTLKSRERACVRTGASSRSCSPTTHKRFHVALGGVSSSTWLSALPLLLPVLGAEQPVIAPSAFGEGNPPTMEQILRALS